MALKVYRTAIGFHDAYVAAPSQKAALAAWGTRKNLFARGDAEIVEDAALATEALATPGKVIKRARGTTAQHVAALSKDRPAGRAKADKKTGKPQPAPRPSRRALETAETALADALANQAAAVERIEERIAELAKERDALRVGQDRERGSLEAARDRAAEDYDAALRDWQG